LIEFIIITALQIKNQEKAMKLRLVVIMLFIITGLLSASEIKNYGEKLTLKETTLISEINKSPEKYVDKAVLVEGRVIDVCKKRGCWIKIAGDKEDESILVKVDDGVIVFPQESKGKMAKVEGKIEKIELTSDETKKEGKHTCGKDCKECDSSKASQVKVTYRLRALGADIEL
jgi:hypothetical protein